MSHPFFTDPRTYFAQGWHDLGTGHGYVKYVNQADQWCGIIEFHQLLDGEWCGESVPFQGFDNDQSRPQWNVESFDPLTLSPSILCSPEKGGCGSHGYIRQGQWVS